MILLAKFVVRLVTFLLLLALSLAGLALAIFEINTGQSGVSLPHLARLIHLPQLRQTVAHWLAQLEAHGPTAWIAVGCGVGAVLLGLLLLAGILIPRRERLVTLESDETGTLAARRRVLAQVATALIEQAGTVADARVKVRGRRTSGGRLKVRATRLRMTDPGDVQAAVREQLANLTDPFKLSARIDVPRRAPRVD